VKKPICSLGYIMSHKFLSLTFLLALSVIAHAEDKNPPSAEVMKRGQTVYSRTCIACHQPTGLGIAPVFPPLAGSEWVAMSPSIPVRNILHGMTGPVTVKGTTYNSMMPAVAGLSDGDIADVVTYVRNSFGNTGSVVTEDDVKAIKAKYADRKTPWTAEEFQKDSK
jgi:mono/diheme cytochrome c family protein